MMACPICSSEANPRGPARTPDGREGYLVECQRCGPYFISEEALQDMAGWHRGDAENIARIAHSVRKISRGGRRPFVTNELVERFLSQPLPTVFEQANNLINWLGANTEPGEPIEISRRTHQYIIGGKNENGVSFALGHLEQAGYLTVNRVRADTFAILTFAGWEQFDKLQRGAVESRKAFMAMQYGDEALDRIVRDVLAPAVAQTGFQLTRLDDAPRAGLIDDSLRIEIRGSRFLIADLTHGNKGAYWEAGYAEGLGKPVIYVCERAVFERERTHFDTNHHLTVIWETGNLELAAEQLKATIRATLPDEANLVDDVRGR